jgi:hypothetical protein
MIQVRVQKKGAKETKENPGLVHRTVRCATGQCPVPRAARLQTCHLRVSGESLRSNSLDCPVCQWSNDYQAQWSTPTVTCKCEQCADSSRKVRAAPEGAPDSEQCLSGAPRCQSSNGRNRQNPNGWVTWLAHRTVRCAHRQTASPTVGLVVGAIYTPQPPIHSKRLVTRERVLLVFFELLFLDRFLPSSFLFPSVL